MKFPSNVDWKGSTRLLIFLLELAEKSCPVSYKTNCGSNQAGCSVCRMLADQSTLDRLLELRQRAHRLAEWDEPLLKFRWDGAEGVLTILAVDGVPERRSIGAS